MSSNLCFVVLFIYIHVLLHCHVSTITAKAMLKNL